MHKTQDEKRVYLNEKQVAELIIDKYMCDHTVQIGQNGDAYGVESC